jgi:hypothetical protein
LKKSKYQSLRRAWWRTHLNDALTHETLSQIDVLVARDVAAAEAAGVKWESELPVGLYFSPAGKGTQATASTAEPTNVVIVSLHADGDGVLEEAVRRYNEFANIAAWRNRSTNG